MDDKTLNALRLAHLAHETLCSDTPDGKQWRNFSSPPEPYFNHPVRVASVVAQLQECTPELYRAALLHDTLEDTTLDPKVIAEQCGEDVLRLVRELTNASKEIPERERKKKSRAERKEMDRAKIATISRPAKLVKYVDRVQNLEECAAASQKWRKKYAAESRLLADVLRGTDPVLDARLAGAIETCEGKPTAANVLRVVRSHKISDRDLYLASLRQIIVMLASTECGSKEKAFGMEIAAKIEQLLASP